MITISFTIKQYQGEEGEFDSVDMESFGICGIKNELVVKYDMERLYKLVGNLLWTHGKLTSNGTAQYYQIDCKRTDYDFDHVGFKDVDIRVVAGVEHAT